MNKSLAKMLQKSEYISASRVTIFLTESYIAEGDFVLVESHVAALIRPFLNESTFKNSTMKMTQLLNKEILKIS